jgi:hypothetical protein
MRPRWSNIGFALLAIALLMLVTTQFRWLNADTRAGKVAAGVISCGLTVAFLWPFAEERLERRRALIGVIIGITFLVLSTLQLFSGLAIER